MEILCAYLSVLGLSSWCGLPSIYYRSKDINATRVEAIAKAQNDFARDFYLSVVEGSDDNVFFSPFSISTCFAMLHMGSQGKTERKMKEVFHFPEDKQELSSGYRNILTSMAKESANYTLRTANRAYIHWSFYVYQDFIDAVSTDFNGGIEKVNFYNSEFVRKKINAFVEEKTNSKIRNIIPEGSLSQKMKMMLVNAIYFKANWKKQFNPYRTQTLPFWTSKTQSVDVEMMMAEDKLYYGELHDLDSKILKLDYQGGDCSFFVILPNKRDGLKELEGKLSTVDLESLEDYLSLKIVVLQLPKFKLEVDISNLNNVLGKMGLTDVFSPGNANFSGISSQSLSISLAIHRAFIDVDEEGSEAAAVTAIGEGPIIDDGSTSPPVFYFYADHPFLFFIKHTRSNTMLFTGRFVKPDKKQ